MKRRIAVKVNPNLEVKFPISLSIPGAGDLTLTADEAGRLASDMRAAHSRIEGHFQCKDPMFPVWRTWVICGKPGKVKRDGKWYCRKHGKAVRP